eukprot:CAMPEP_0184860782 /NCGR_PEP_ID=MMETSP0580-20130426/5597_1 /TAXON_ID=1118495 /ORGANISM="Dactyliosolen fragilissimus" /LENGTH=572 /DNA_ID=CAMNT_0027358007 /DNA_START=116 /DNA_END=1830 /DNA_ORIENTATION=+
MIAVFTNQKEHHHNIISSSSSLLFFIILLFFSTVVHSSQALSSKQPNPLLSYDLLVIGGGSAGLTAAKFASRFGKSVAIVEKARMGGDCTWTGCVPSKSLVASAKVAHTVRQSSKFGIGVQFDSRHDSDMMDKVNANNIHVKVDFPKVMARAKENIQRIYDEDDSPLALKKLGIDVIQGTATFQSANTLIVSPTITQTENDAISDDKSHVLQAKYGILIATGAHPVRPTDKDLPGIESVQHVTYEEIFDLEQLPHTITIVGGGPIGCELSQIFARFGSQVTIVSDRLLPKEEPEVGSTLSKIFESEGIKVIQGTVTSVSPLQANNHDNQSNTNHTNETKTMHTATCSNGQTISGHLLVVAVGRNPVVQGMGIEKLGIDIDKQTGGILVNEKLATNIKGIYAAGDCTGGEQFTHYAGYQGAVGARNILLPLSDPGKLTMVPSTTFVDPEIASIGMTQSQAEEAFGKESIAVAFQEVNETDRGICEGSSEGFIKIVYSKKGYKILGATIISPVAGEILAEISTAIKTNLSFDLLATVMHSYPSHAFALQAMACQVYYDKLAKSKRILNFLKKVG